ncbi:MAG TPA: oxidoreductase [Acetobacteraceae bacterium]|jgi:hypothetical protein|nr:oxidoreductase [Acetobacteraceae bacterium]
MLIRRRRFCSLAIAALGTAVAPVARRANAEGATPEQPILTISGKISVAGNAASFTRSMLEATGLRSFTTKTPWYDAPVTFEGVPMALLMRTVGARGDRVTAIALNDYSTDIPMSDFDQYGVILALKRDGNYMPIRDKGPLFIVYPYDSNPILRSTTYTSRSAWQVSQLIVK